MSQIILDTSLAPGTYTLTLEGQPVPSPVPIPAPSPVSPPPAATGCANQMRTGDLVWSPMLDVSLFPSPILTTSGDLGASIQFTADGAKWPNGITLMMIDDAGGGAFPKDFVISSCPHNFDGLPASWVANGNISGTVLYLRYSTSTQPVHSYD